MPIRCTEKTHCDCESTESDNLDIEILELLRRGEKDLSRKLDGNEKGNFYLPQKE